MKLVVWILIAVGFFNINNSIRTCESITVLPITEEKRFCQCCGAQVQPDASFCSKCGKMVTLTPTTHLPTKQRCIVKTSETSRKTTIASMIV